MTEITTADLWGEIKTHFPEMERRERAAMVIDLVTMGISAAWEGDTMERAIDGMVERFEPEPAPAAAPEPEKKRDEVLYFRKGRRPEPRRWRRTE